EAGDRRMTNNALGAAVLTAALAISSPALARAPAPLVPTALVEDVKSASADVEFMDYVGTGQVIKLEPSDVPVLGYLKPCEPSTTGAIASDTGASESLTIALGGSLANGGCPGRHKTVTRLRRSAF